MGGVSKEKEEKEIFYQWENIIYLILVYKILDWYKKKKAGAMVNVCTLSKFIYWNPNTQYNGVRRRGFWKTRSCSGTFINGMSDFTKEIFQSSLALSTTWGYKKKCVTWKRALTPSCWHPDLEFPGSKTLSNKFLLFISHSFCGTLLQTKQLRSLVWGVFKKIKFV